MRPRWRWDSWYCQPWAWLWSDLERDRLGRWLGPWVILTWIGPGVLIGHGIGFLLTGLMSAVLPLGMHDWAERRSRRRGWQTVFWEPTSWAVRRATERVVWGDPAHWAAIPHYERHTPERRWPSPDAFHTARRNEWARLAAMMTESPQCILIAHTFSTVRGVPDQWRCIGTPFRALARREARALFRVQRRMFDTTISRKGPSVADPQGWTVVIMPHNKKARTEQEACDSDVRN